MKKHLVKMELSVHIEEPIQNIELLVGNIAALLQEVRPDLVLENLHLNSSFLTADLEFLSYAKTDQPCGKSTVKMYTTKMAVAIYTEEPIRDVELLMANIEALLSEVRPDLVRENLNVDHSSVTADLKLLSQEGCEKAPTAERAAESPFYDQEINHVNLKDALDWLSKDELVAIVSERHGGIVGYVHKAHANEINAALASFAESQWKAPSK